MNVPQVFQKVCAMIERAMCHGGLDCVHASVSGDVSGNSTVCLKTAVKPRFYECTVYCFGLKYKNLWLVFYPLSRNVLQVAFRSCLQALFVYPVLVLSKHFPLKVRFLDLGRWASLMFVLKHLRHPLLHDVLPHH